jgi:hypothetical protein
VGSGLPWTLRCSKSGDLTPGSDRTAINFEPEQDSASTLVLAKTVLAMSAPTRIPVRLTGATPWQAVPSEPELIQIFRNEIREFANNAAASVCNPTAAFANRLMKTRF